MFHPYRKDSSHLRAAIFKSYKEKCEYCGRTIQQRDMHIDHIIPVNRRQITDDEVRKYIIELEENGFITDSIENYLPACAACNVSKSNRLFSAANLRFYHEQARVHVEEIIKRIEALKETEETYYEPVDREMWEELDFSYQRDLSHAIMGYRLTAADVLACPRFPQVDKIKKQLEIVDYTVIAGETGCGKSISVYQAAFDYYEAGWRVYRYKALNDSVAPRISENMELSLYIFDDAQLLTEQIIETIKMQARPNAKILFAITESVAVKQDMILLTNKEAVELMYDDFQERKDEIIPIVRKCDKSIGISFMDQPIERRLRAARQAITPWQFNYVLRGGWQTMKERYQTICRHNDCDLLATTIAVCQIMKLDHGIEYEWLCKEINKIDNSFTWTSKDLKYLAEKMIVLSEEDVRIVHMESAKVIIALFIKDGEEKKKQVLLEFVEHVFVNKYFPLLGIVWLCNGVRSYSSIYSIYEYFVTEQMIESALESLGDYISSEERMWAAVFMEMVFNLKCGKNGNYYFNRHEDILREWVQCADSKTAYAYSDLANTLINKDVKQHKKFVSKFDWTMLQEKMLNENKPDLYAWGRLFNRLLYSFSKKEYLSIGKLFELSIERLASKATISNIEGVTSFYCSIMHTNEEAVRSAIEKLIPLYDMYFKKDMYRAIELFDFDFLGYVCGLSLLGRYRASKAQKKSAQLIVSVIPEKEFAETISKCLPRDWHSVNPIMMLIGRYDTEKAKRIVNLIDMNSLGEKAKDSWESSHEISELCDILYIGNYKVARRFIEDNMDKIHIMYSTFVMMSPKLAIKAFEKGIEVELVTEHWWEVSLFALKELLRIDSEKARGILTKNIPKFIEKINSITALEFNERYCLDFWLLVYKSAPEVIELITSSIDSEKIKRDWCRGSIYKGKEEQVEFRRKQFFELMNISDEDKERKCHVPNNQP